MTASVSRATIVATLVRSLDTDLIASLALSTRHRAFLQDEAPSDLTCSVINVQRGDFNVVYRVNFSDRVSWVVRIPFSPWSGFRTRAMHHDMVGLQFILKNTSLPVPRVHAYSCSTDNILRHPYIIMDYIYGICLADVWNEPSWWTGARSKGRTLRSIARHMVELSKFEFDKIGCLDVADDDSYKVVPFVTPFIEDLDFEPPESGFGPFTTTHAYLLALHDARVRENGGSDAKSAMLRLFLGGVPDPRYDGAPFTLCPPDFDSQNILVDDSGDVVAFIDWDGIATQPRQLGALKYPAWLTIDWDPRTYDEYKEEPPFDTPEELHMYREMYVNAVDEVSGGTLGDVVRNSHVVSVLRRALRWWVTMSHIVVQVGKYVFEDRYIVRDLLGCIRNGVWNKLGEREIAQVEGEFVIAAPISRVSETEWWISRSFGGEDGRLEHIDRMV